MGFGECRTCRSRLFERPSCGKRGRTIESRATLSNTLRGLQFNEYGGQSRLTYNTVTVNHSHLCPQGNRHFAMAVIGPASAASPSKQMVQIQSCSISLNAEEVFEDSRASRSSMQSSDRSSGNTSNTVRKHSTVVCIVAFVEAIEISRPLAQWKIM